MKLAAALRENRLAHEEYVNAASAIPPDTWALPAKPGKWSAGEITEHLRLALEALHRELRGEAPMKSRVPSWKQFLFRSSVLPRMLRKGWFPSGVRAPRETRPAAPAVAPAEALRGLTEALDRFEAACAGDGRSRRRLTHPYFGPLTLSRFHRLLALHTRHHRAQLPQGPWNN